MVTYALKYPIEFLSVAITLLPISTFVYTKAYTDKRLKYLFWMLVCKISIDTIGLHLAIKGQNNIYLANILVLIQHSLLTKLFFEAICSNKTRKFIKQTFLIFLITYIVDFYSVGLYHSLRYAPTLQCLFMIGYCVGYFFDLTRSLEVVNLLTDKFFIIASATLLLFASTTFITPLYHYLDRWDYEPNLLIFTYLGYIIEIFYLIIISLAVFARR